MGRRALPKIADDARADAWLVTPAAVGESFNATQWFGRRAPLEIEIGSGKGLFLRNMALACPDRDFLGIEVVGKYARFVAARLAAQQLGNARVLHGDGVAFLDTVPTASVAALHVYFPDPWWKKRHRKRRVMNERLLRATERILVPDGRLHFWTDVEEYFQSTLELIQSTSQLQGPLPVTAELPLHDMDYRTHFERRVRINDLPVYRAEFFKQPWRIDVEVAGPGAADSLIVGNIEPRDI